MHFFWYNIRTHSTCIKGIFKGWLATYLCAATKLYIFVVHVVLVIAASGENTRPAARPPHNCNNDVP
jgi:hypothetical protein